MTLGLPARSDTTQRYTLRVRGAAAKSCNLTCSRWHPHLPVSKMLYSRQAAISEDGAGALSAAARSGMAKTLAAYVDGHYWTEFSVLYSKRARPDE